MNDHLNDVRAVGLEPEPAAAPEVEIWTEAQCWDRLATGGTGRFAVESGRGARIYPVSFVVNNQIVYFRTGPGEKVMNAWAHPQVAFEADGQDGDRLWSVVVEGEATILGTDFQAFRPIADGLVTQHPTPKTMIVAISADQISGRSFQTVARASLWAVG